MRVGAVQLVQPRDTPFTLRGLAARTGRVALLYLAIASLGAALTLFSFLLTWHNVFLAIIGLLVGLGVVHSATMLIDMIRLLARDIHRDAKVLRKQSKRLAEAVRGIWHDDDTKRVLMDELLVLVRHTGVLVTVMLIYVASHEAFVLRWSGLTGVYAGIALFVIVRVIFHAHGFGPRRGRSGSDR